MSALNRLVALVAVLIFLGSAIALLPAGAVATSRPVATGSSALTGSVSGPTLLAQRGSGSYTINATGGPAYAANGTQVGNLTFYASVAAGNTTGVTLTPGSAALVNGTFRGVLLVVNSVLQVVTITVEIASVYQSQNETVNLTYQVTVIQPYVVSATIVNRSTVTVLTFELSVFLDGVAVSTVSVPQLTSGGSYTVSYQYVVASLPAGWHTFSMSLANEHGLVTFTNGSTVYTSSFYVTGPSTDYTWWYVAGITAFFGVLLILVISLAARRRSGGKK